MVRRSNGEYSARSKRRFGKTRPLIRAWSPPGSRAALSIQAGHRCGEAGLIDEHELRRIEIELAIEPVPAPLQDVRAILLQCVRGLFECPAVAAKPGAQVLRLIRIDRRPAAHHLVLRDVLALLDQPDDVFMRIDAGGRGGGPAGVASDRRSSRAQCSGSRWILHPEPCRRLPRRHALVRSLQDPRPGGQLLTRAPSSSNTSA